MLFRKIIIQNSTNSTNNEYVNKTRKKKDIWRCSQRKSTTPERRTRTRQQLPIPDDNNRPIDMDTLWTLSELAVKFKNNLISILWFLVESGCLASEREWYLHPDHPSLMTLSASASTIEAAECFIVQAYVGLDSITGQNTTEGSWFHIKRSFSKFGARRSMLGKFFAEFIYKRKFGSPYEKNGYLRFLEHIAIVTNRGTWYENEMRQTQQQDNQELQRLLDELSDGEHD